MVALVSIDVDRSAGAHAGRLHAAWQEGLNIDADVLGAGGTTGEAEPDDNSAAATSFAVGATLSGSLASTTDQDWWSFSGAAGQTFVAYLVPNGSACNGFLRLFAGGGATANRAAYSHFGGGVGIVQFTLPSTGTYWLRVLNWDGVAGNVGSYVVYTGWHAPNAADHARDHRDVMHAWSDDGGANWSVPAVVSDAAPYFDEAWPEVAVDAAGRVHVAWYDHRDDPANGILTTHYYARSDDGGASFHASQRFSTGSPVNWSNVATNLFPNAGDYSALVADGMNVYANWADGRDGTPDSYFARLVDGAVAVEPPASAPAARLALVALRPVRGGAVRLLLEVAEPGDVRLELFDLAGRRAATMQWTGTAAGSHVVEVGAGLPAGLFFARASQAGRTAATRVTALR